jgi:hypothetical protein
MALLVGTHRSRIKPGRAETLVDELALLPIVAEAALSRGQLKPYSQSLTTMA